MSIARLIADPATLETRLEQLHAALAEKQIAVEVIRGRDGTVSLSIRGAKAEMLDSAAHGTFLCEVLAAAFPADDWIVGNEGLARPSLVVSDMDSTMIGQECIDELAHYAGIKDQIAAITERAMQGEIDFEGALRERVALLGGLDESAITRCLEERIRLNPGACELIQTLKGQGARTVLVTGGFHHFADRVAEQIGFDRVVGNRLTVKGGKLTGDLDGPVSDANTKASVLREEMAALGAGATSLALGDGANDIPMLQAATYGIAYMAKPIAKAAADGRIESGDLANVLNLLGIARGEFSDD
ncbi:MAG: phosphoserine phosphatase SerB [Erythrobacter sp.]